MKKVFLIVQNKDVHSALESLRDLGTVHIEHEQKPVSNNIAELREQVQGLERVITILSQEKKNADQIAVDDWQARARTIFGLLGLINQYQEGCARRQSQINFWEPWGDFDPEDIEDLEEKGIYIQFAEVPEKRLEEMPKGVIVQEIYKQEGVIRCLAISQEKIHLPFNVLALPPVSPLELREVQERNLDRIRRAKEKIIDNTQYLESFKNILSGIEEDLYLQEAVAGKGEAESLAILKGFCPQDRCDGIQARAKKEHWGLIIEDPARDEQVPTLIRNPKWVSLIKPVFDFINILPGYKEVDISIFFLVFFSLFVGMLIGDAAYGLIFAFLTFIAHITVGRKCADKTPFYLVYILSGCTICWGVLTGTFFGQQWLPEGTIKPLLPWLTDNNNVQMFCFLLGAIHLSLAHIWRVAMKMPSLSFIGDLGWLSIIWGMYYLAKFLILGTPLPAFANAFFIAGPIMIIFFTQPNKNPLKAMGPGLGDFLLNVINTFTDVVSYIRLFAVGLATVAVADATNAMAMGIGFDSFGSGAGASLVLFVGHLINIILAVMAILVHGLRLNVLEFSGHLNMEWAGFEYNPFRKLRKV